jgi:hypothetical protein
MAFTTCDTNAQRGGIMRGEHSIGGPWAANVPSTKLKLCMTSEVPPFENMRLPLLRDVLPP